MRIPHVIEINTQKAYSPSNLTLKLKGEVNRRIYPEDFEWDQNAVDTLATQSLYVIAENFEKNPILNELIPLDKDHLLEILSTDLSLELVVPLIEDEYYWQRRYTEQFGSILYKKHLGWTWKCLYLERYVQKICEEAESQYQDEITMQETLQLVSAWVHALQITELQQWKPPKTLIASEWPQVFPVTHISFAPIFENLPNLVEVDICYCMKNVGVDYDPHMFKIDPVDCTNLGAAVLLLKHIKVLRLRRSLIECAHIKALMRQLVENATLVELDFSYCKIGNLGAKCIAMFLCKNETLKILNLRNNLVEFEGACGLGWALLNPEGAKLHRVDLSLNPLHHDGTMAIFRALVRGNAPHELSLAGCFIQGETALRLGGMLLLNRSLRLLNISSNNLGKEGGEAILSAMIGNNKLISLDMRQTNIPKDIEEQINVYLKRNATENPYLSKSNINFGFIDKICSYTSYNKADRDEDDENLDDSTYYSENSSFDSSYHMSY